MANDTIADWAAARSDKWRRQLAGMEAMLAPIDEPLIAALALDTASRIADVGCGGGATTCEVLRRAPAGSVAHGFDLSPALIEVARRRRAGTAAIRFEVADMESAAPPDGPYERLVSRLGIMFFNEPPTAFTNLHRWLLPGGRFAFAVWGPADDNEWLMVTRETVAAFVDLPPIDPTAPGPFRYAGGEPLLSLLERGGFVQVRMSDWHGRLPIGGALSPADAAQFALASFSSFAERLSAAGGDALDKARHALTLRFARYEQHGAVLMGGRVHIVSGR
jgi:SAM-dependent methyltransferase